MLFQDYEHHTDRPQVSGVLRSRQFFFKGKAA